MLPSGQWGWKRKAATGGRQFSCGHSIRQNIVPSVVMLRAATDALRKHSAACACPGFGDELFMMILATKWPRVRWLPPSPRAEGRS